MNNKLYTLGILLVLGTSIISGCGTASAEPSTVTPPVEEDPTKVPELVPTTAVPPAKENPTWVPELIPTEGMRIKFNGAIATAVMTEMVPATDEHEPTQMAKPAHVEFSLNGYALPDTFHEPRILVYPVAEFEAINEYARKTIADMRQLLVDRPAAPKEIPFLPPFHAGQMMRAQIAYIDFQNGKGVRFLTQYAQTYLPINNHELFYTFQGLTSDGQYYVAAILPVSHPILPADQMAYEGGDLDTLAQSFDTYIAEIEEQLHTHDASSFTPDLNLLDAMIQSLEVALTWTTAVPPTAEGEDGAYPGWKSYTNEEYGFTFRYPEAWTLTEEPHLVRLSRGTMSLNIAHGWASNPAFSPMGGRTGMPAGDFIYGGKVFFLEQMIPAQVLEYERKDKLVLYGDLSLVNVGDLVFSIWLEDVNNANYSELDIPKELQAEVKEILESFERIEATSEPPDPTTLIVPEADVLIYENAAYGFSFQYPASWTIEEVTGETIDTDSQVSKLADAVIIRQGKFAIVVQYQRKSDPAQIAWGGNLVPGGLGYAEATLGDRVTLLGEETYKYVWTYDGGIKAIEVNTTGKTADLVLSITLGDSSVGVIQDAEAATIPESASAALGQVLSSFTATQ
jgi:hypothetical protein